MRDFCKLSGYSARCSPNIGTRREEPLALPVDRANDATASTPRKPRGIPENSGDDNEETTVACYPEGVRENVHEDTDWGRQGHGSNSELGYPRFALANGRENDVDPSGHKTSGESSSKFLTKISLMLEFATSSICESLTTTVKRRLRDVPET